MKQYIAFNQNAYDQLAEEYNQRAGESFICDKSIINPFMGYLRYSFGKIKILELGPGPGISLSIFEREGFGTWGIDVSSSMISLAKSRSPGTEYINKDFLEYDFKNLRFEGIFASAFIHLFAKRDALFALRKIKSLLLPGGILFLSTTIHETSEEGYFEKSDYAGKIKRFRRRWAEGELMNVLGSLDFEILSRINHQDSRGGKVWLNLFLTVKPQNYQDKTDWGDET